MIHRFVKLDKPRSPHSTKRPSQRLWQRAITFGPSKRSAVAAAHWAAGCTAEQRRKSREVSPVGDGCVVVHIYFHRQHYRLVDKVWEVVLCCGDWCTWTSGLQEHFTMKVLRRQISSKDGDGFVQMKTEEAEDMWHAYNLIADGDRVRTSTVRKVWWDLHQS